ncbi:BCS1 N terminal-domain-containing protein [Suillus fuscotomentosus]|uniref:BCS1 N terminal-domain-containing protein n=1 Tax=Suillus fuscotomentosus TaxID=1912939 RepID=A0AAD4EGK0_9AGAM|nr:BCS1 N terminal-domain-containing protein [Suillus fuscotomentosus]KAG1905860.1 BCS1 N terminal-domain-containing protein [Suillus fuscotomentosus]
MAIHNASRTPSLDGQVANAPGLTSTTSTGLAIPQDAGTASSSIISSLIGDNPYFQAGFGLMGVGVGLTILRQGLVFGTTALRRRLLVSLEVNNKDRAYEWFLAWLAHNAQPAAPTSRRTESWLRSHQLSVETAVEQRSNGSSSVLFRLVAGPGTHWFKYGGAWMQMKRERETRSMQLMSGTPWETVTVTTLSRDRHLFSKLLAEARDLALRGQEGKLVIRTAWGIEWKPFGQPRRKRPLHSVVLDTGVSEKVEQDVNAFLQRRQWYADRGIPYRRGYLLHGPPGSGKTSYIQALAGSLSYDICLLNLSERGLGDDKLNHLLSNAPERSIILIEDVDAAFNKRMQTSEDGYQSSVTFSGFLNALDGVASGEERIIFMTTNHFGSLDPALIRPGRVDLSVLVDNASPIQARTLFTRFYGGSESIRPELIERMGRQVEEFTVKEMSNGKEISMAALQGLFIRNNAQDAVKTLPELFVDRRT